MNFFTNLLAGAKNLLNMSEDNNLIVKWLRLLKTLSWLGVVSIILLEYYGFREMITVEINVIETFKEHLLNNCIAGFIVSFVYLFFIKNQVVELLIDIQLEKQKNYFPIKDTIEDVWGIFFQVCISLKIVYDFVLCIAGVSVIDTINSYIYLFVIVEVVFRYIYRLYRVNVYLWKNQEILYTDFFDSDGNRIPEKGKLVYQNRLYNLCYKDKEWWLSSKENHFLSKDISLESAAKDIEGKLKVYYPGMGEKKNQGSLF